MIPFEEVKQQQPEPSSSPFEQMLLNVMEGGSTEELEYVLRYFPQELSTLGDSDELKDVLTSYRFLQKKVDYLSFAELYSDFLQSGINPPLSFVRKALLNSRNAVERNSKNLPTYLYGRLLGVNDKEVTTLLRKIPHTEKRVWLKPMNHFRNNVRSPLAMTLENAGMRFFQSINGRHLVSGGQDGFIRIWDLASSENVDLFKAHEEPITFIGSTKDAKRIISCDKSNTVKVWDTNNNEMVVEFKAHDERIISIQTLNNTHIVTASDDKSVRLWNSDNGDLVGNFEGHTAYIQQVLISQDLKSIITSSYDKTIRVWDIENKKLIFNFSSHDKSIGSIFESHDGMYIVSGSMGGVVKVLSKVDGNVVDEYKLENNTVNEESPQINFILQSKNHQNLLVGLTSGSVRILDLRSGHLLNKFDGHNSIVTEMLEVQDRFLITSAFRDNRIKIWDIDSAENIRTINTGGWVESIGVTQDEKYMFTISRGQSALWEIETGNLLFKFQSTSMLNKLVQSNDSQFIIASSRDGSIRVWDIASIELNQKIFGHAGGISFFENSDDGNYFMTWSETDATLNKWDRFTSELVFSQKIEGRVKKLLKSRDSVHLFAYTLNKIWIWDMGSGLLQHTLDVPEGMQSIQESYDTKYIIAVGDYTNSIISIWEKETGQMVSRLEGHTEVLRSVVQSNDGEFIISAGKDQTIRIWHKLSGSLLHILEGHTDEISQIFLSQDDTYIISRSKDKSIKVWSKATGALLTDFKNHTNEITFVKESKIDQHIISSSKVDRSIKVWDMLSGEIVANMIHDRDVEYVEESTDGKYIISLSRDLNERLGVNIWNKNNGKLTSVFSTDGIRLQMGSAGRYIIPLQQSTHSQLIFTTTFQGTFYLWDRENPDIRREYIGHTDQVTKIIETTNGNYLVTSSKDNTVRIWNTITTKNVGVVEVDWPVSEVVISEENNQIVVVCSNGEILWFKLENLNINNNLE